MFTAIYEFFLSAFARSGGEKAVARVGDPITHGGSVTAGSPTVKANGLAVARVGDAVNCAVHGAQTITGTGASTAVKANGIGIARLGTSISCGATISAA